MPRNMSFMLTTAQVKARTKTVTRRLGWKTLRKYTVLNACEKCMGLKKGETVNILCQIKVVSVERERLSDIIHRTSDLQKEGFPGLTPWGFVEMFCHEMKCKPSAAVTRIEFEYL